MKVILHSDDFGYDKDTVEATIDCFERGALSSASVMVNCEASEEAFAYAKRHPEFSFGVHLTFVDGLKPVLPPKQISALVDSNGLFLPSNTVRKLAMMLKLPKSQVQTKMILLAEHQSSVKKQKYIQMTHAHVAVVKNTNNAVAVRLKTA